MRSNRWESALGITAFGESHGPAVGVVLEDIKPGVEFPLNDIQQELEKRRPGKSKFSSSRQEADKIKVISGVFNGLTTGMPICLLVYNKDIREADYEQLKGIFRPGHADFSYYKKFKIYDYRGGGRASGRETIARVAAGAIVKKLIEPVKIRLYPIQIGKFRSIHPDPEFSNELYWQDRSNYQQLIAYLDKIKQKGDSVGGIIECSIEALPAGLGDPVFEKLDANLAKAIISIGAVKGIEFGDGFTLAERTGSQANDDIRANGFLSNHSGGILGGISTGQTLKFRFVVKPVPSVRLLQKTINTDNEEFDLTLKGRHDTCIIPRIIPVAKAMITLVLADAVSYQKLVSGCVLDLNDYRESIDKLDEDILILIKKRLNLAALIGAYKNNQNLPVIDENREKELLNSITKKAEILSLSSAFIEKIWKQIIKESKELQ
jgi:chorismate synthase